MKTVTYVESEIKHITELLASYRSIKATNAATRHQLKRLLFLKSEILPYLRTGPREEYLKNDLERIERTIARKQKQYSKWLKNACPEDLPEHKRKPLFNKETGITQLNKNKKTLKYILE